MAEYFIPRGDEDFLEFLRILVNGVVASTSYTAAQKAEAKACLAGFAKVLDETRDLATKYHSKVAEKNGQKQDCTALIRRVNAEQSKSSDEVRRSFGLPIYDRTPTPSAPITTRPVIEVDAREFLQHLLTIRDEQERGFAKPKGAFGFSVRVHVGENPPADIMDWEEEGIATKKNFTVHYDVSQGGQTAHIAGYWIGKDGSFGPVSEIVRMTILASR